MVAELTQAVERGASQIIQRTYTGETGAWAHNGLLKLMLQFRTFSLISVEKQWGRNVQNYGALKAFATLVGTASLALPIHLARVQANMLSKAPDKRQAYWEENTGGLAMTRAVMNYASASGLAGDILDIGATFTANIGGEYGTALGDSYGVRGKQTDKFIGGVVAPSAGLANDLWGGVIGADPKKIMRSVPGGNLPYVSPFIQGALQAAEAE